MELEAAQAAFLRAAGRRRFGAADAGVGVHGEQLHWQQRKCEHGAILKVVTTNICGSDQHMVRGRTSLPGGHMVLGHEITGEVIETGAGCEFIKPGDVFHVVDGVITNFHEPQSSLLMLIAAFAGREAVLVAYAHAVAEDYRFLSYGDAMFIA